MCTASPARHLLDFGWSAQNRKKPAKYRVSRIQRNVSGIPKKHQKCRKEAADTGNIQVFGRF
jgi:hypothetical protein